MTRCSRPMSWAEPSRLPSGGRRSAQRAGGVGDAEGQVRAAAGDPLERERRLAPATFASNQASTPRGRSRQVACASAMAREHIHTRLLVDFGGVLTTTVWASFAAFCEAEGLAPDAVKILSTDPRPSRMLRGLETGELDDAEFEPRFGGPRPR